MKFFLNLLFFTFLCLLIHHSYADEAHSQQNTLEEHKCSWDSDLASPNLKKELAKLKQSLTIFKIGSPGFNLSKDFGRILADIEKDFPAHEKYWDIYNVHQWRNITPHSMIGMSSSGKIYVLEFEHTSVSSVKEYFIDQGKGFCELVVEVYRDVMFCGGYQGLIQPVLEIETSLASDTPLHVRWTKDVESLGESATSFYNTFYDFGDKASKGDVMRSLKAIARLPINVVDISLKTANKTIALPFDLIRTSIDALLEEDLNSEQKVMKTIVENNDYDVELTLNGDKFGGYAWFNPVPNDLSTTIQADSHLTLISENKEERLANLTGHWRVEFPGELNGTRFISQWNILGKPYLFVGEVDGQIDVEIKGYILELEKGVAILGQVLPAPIYYERLEEEAVGKFYFND